MLPEESESTPPPGLKKLYPVLLYVLLNTVIYKLPLFIDFEYFDCLKQDILLELRFPKAVSILFADREQMPSSNIAVIFLQLLFEVVLLKTIILHQAPTLPDAKDEWHVKDQMLDHLLFLQKFVGQLDHLL